MPHFGELHPHPTAQQNRTRMGSEKGTKVHWTGHESPCQTALSLHFPMKSGLGISLTSWRHREGEGKSHGHRTCSITVKQGPAGSLLCSVCLCTPRPPAALTCILWLCRFPCLGTASPSLGLLPPDKARDLGGVSSTKPGQVVLEL